MVMNNYLPSVAPQSKIPCFHLVKECKKGDIRTTALLLTSVYGHLPARAARDDVTRVEQEAKDSNLLSDEVCGW